MSVCTFLPSGRSTPRSKPVGGVEAEHGDGQVLPFSISGSRSQVLPVSISVYTYHTIVLTLMVGTSGIAIFDLYLFVSSGFH